MKSFSIWIGLIFLIFNSCDIKRSHPGEKNSYIADSLVLVNMIHARSIAMKNKDISAVMSQFSDEATFINSDGYFLGGFWC